MLLITYYLYAFNVNVSRAPSMYVDVIICLFYDLSRRAAAFDVKFLLQLLTQKMIEISQ